MAQGQSTKTISWIKRVRTSRLSVKNSLSLGGRGAGSEGCRFFRGRAVDQSQEDWTGKVYVRLPGKGNSNPHGARIVHQIISMIEWIRTSRLSIKNSLSRKVWGVPELSCELRPDTRLRRMLCGKKSSRSSRLISSGAWLTVWGSGLIAEGRIASRCGFRVQDLGFRIQDVGFRVQDLGFRVQDLRFRVLDLG